VDTSNDACLIEASQWELFPDGSVCSKGQGVGCVIVAPNGALVDLSVILEFASTNNEAEYEVLLCGLEYLRDIGVKRVSAYGDSKLVVQEMRGESQCLDGILNSYLAECLDIVRMLQNFRIDHIPGLEKSKADALVQ
jgi:ribonuclease HI